MASAARLKLNDKFLDTFYRELGRELSLAYTVLNQTNTWAITFFGVLCGSAVSQLTIINKDTGAAQLVEPTIALWVLSIAGWCLMLRFFQRSNLALENMYRWNTLMTQSLRTLLLNEESEQKRQENNAELIKEIDRLLINWRAPKKVQETAWNSLRLMYLGPMAVLLCTVGWGAIHFRETPNYCLCLCALAIWTTFEAYLFWDWVRGGTRIPIASDGKSFLDWFQSEITIPPPVDPAPKD